MCQKGGREDIILYTCTCTCMYNYNCIHVVVLHFLSLLFCPLPPPQATVWQELLLAAVGEQFVDSVDKNDSVCGVSVRIRGFDQDIVQIWNQDSELHTKATVSVSVYTVGTLYKGRVRSIDVVRVGRLSSFGGRSVDTRLTVTDCVCCTGHSESQRTYP